mgnify:CR=1 FL=1
MKAVVIKSNATNEPIVTLRMFGFVIDKKQNTIAQNIPNYEKDH